MISWCEHCVAGKSRSNKHVQSKEEKFRLGVTWNADYAIMSGDHNEGEHAMQPALILYDDDKDCYWALGIDAKGATEAMVQYGVGTIEQLSYIEEKLTFKSDQEQSIVALKNEVAADKVRERQDHDMAQQVQQGQQIGEREGFLRKEDIAEPKCRYG